MFILQYVVGVRLPVDQCPLPGDSLQIQACDVQPDGACNVIDALILQQCVVGKPNSWCPQSAGASADGTHRRLPQPNGPVDDVSIELGQTAFLPDSMLQLPMRTFLVDDMVGAATIELRYDPTVLQAVACNPDPADRFDLSSCNLDFKTEEDATKSIRFSLLALDGVTGEISLAAPVFRIIDEAIQNTHIEIIPVVWSDPTGTRRSVRAGTTTIFPNGQQALDNPDFRVFLPHVAR
jgi:hypothetical protein